MQELQTAFSMFDRDSDREISKEELMQTFQDLGHICSSEDIDEIFRQYNIKGEGINFDKFAEIARNKQFSEELLDHDLYQAFKTFDRDNLDFISRTDLNHILKNYCKSLTNKEIDELLNEVDKNGDGNITFKEFIDMIMMK